MDLFEAIKGRRSIRAYKDEPVDEKDLYKMLKYATYAPSAGNLQPWEFIIVKSEEKKKALAKAAYSQMFITEAPIVIVVCANIPRTSIYYGSRGENLYVIQDTAAAIQNLLLVAYALGYGTCWVGAFDEDEVRRILGLPNYVRPMAIIPIGRPKRIPKMPPRIPVERLTHYEKFGNPYKWKNT